MVYFSSVFVFAQKRQLNGILTDTTGRVIANANVILKNEKEFLLSFVYSDSKGFYKITIPDTVSLSNLFLEVTSLGYKVSRQPIVSNKNVYNFILEAQAIDLKEVLIKRRPTIITTGDTLSYDVASFSRPEDRSIGDVIKRLPGIAVAENGQISYNGKPIANLFIHGDDLMDGRYGLATKAINKNMIKSIDVMQNFQPIKVLKNKVYTEDVAMNLVLKDENSMKFAGQAMIGIGFPEQYDAAFNAMLFNKKIKILNSLKANNSGIDFRNDFAQLGTPVLSNDAGNSKPSNLLNLGTVGNPDLPKMNYYLNNSQLLNTNNLLNLNNGLQIKSNAQIFFDQNNLNYANSVSNYLNGDTIKYSEVQNINNNPYAVITTFTITANKNTYFFNNKLSLNFEGNKANSYLNFNDQDFTQNLKERKINFFSDLSYIPTLGASKNVMDLRWYVSYFNNPQQLKIDSGLNASILNQGISYLGSNQQLAIPTFLNNVSITYRLLNNHLIQQNYQVGLINERQEFNSKLNVLQLTNNFANYTGDVGNSLIWQRDRLFANAEYTINKTKFKASLTIPFMVQSIHYAQSDYNLDERNTRLFINPKASLTVNLNDEDYLSFNYRFTNNFGGIQNIYRGAVLSNYRTLLANNTDLQETLISNLSSSYHFKRSIIMLFATAKLDYRKVTANTILSSVLTDNIQRSVLRYFENDQSALTFNADISKYVFAINTTATLSSTLGLSNLNQFINDKLYPFSNQVFTFRAKIESKFFGKLTLSYDGLGLWNSSKQKPREGINLDLSNKSKRFDQSLNLGYSPANNLFINVIGKQIYGKQANINSINYTFVDISTRYKIIKWRTDIEFNISNLANIKNYEVFSLSANQFFVSNYEIRGRMAILRATFNL